MQMSDQIITVLDDLCRRFGIAIDWSQQNIVPYLEDLCKRYIQYEIFTSIAFCIIATVIVAMFGVAWLITSKIDNRKRSYASGELKTIFCICFLVSIIAFLLICSVQAFDIIACNTIPEKKIIEYINHLISLKQ